MPRRRTGIGWLRIHDHDSFVAHLREALTDARGQMNLAAHYLGVCRRNLLRWVHHESLWPLLDELRRAEWERRRDEREEAERWNKRP